MLLRVQIGGICLKASRSIRRGQPMMNLESQRSGVTRLVALWVGMVLAA
jgi:hypothetical protein